MYIQEKRKVNERQMRRRVSIFFFFCKWNIMGIE